MAKHAPSHRPIGHRSTGARPTARPIAWPTTQNVACSFACTVSLALAFAAPTSFASPFVAPYVKERGAAHAAERVATQRAATLRTDPAALTPDQIHALVARAILNQHKDDAALDEYERTERITTRGAAGATHEAITRVVPHGITGSFRVQLERDSMPTDAQALERQWRNVQQTMATYADVNNPLVRIDQEKAARQNHEFDQLKDAIGMAFEFHWVGRVTRDNRTLIELSFDPDPSYKPSLRYSNLFQHVRGTAWIDESSGQVTKVEAELFDDVSFGAGIIAKLYRGAKLTVDQAEIAPGVWLPTVYDVDLDGRKFLFSLSMHQKIAVSAYRRIGTPQEALALLERDFPVAPGAPGAAAHGDRLPDRDGDRISDPFGDH
jgi:hypothetical protein